VPDTRHAEARRVDWPNDKYSLVRFEFFAGFRQTIVRVMNSTFLKV